MKLGLILSCYIWCAIIFGVCVSVDLFTWNIYGLIVDFIGVLVFTSLVTFKMEELLEYEEK